MRPIYAGTEINAIESALLDVRTALRRLWASELALKPDENQSDAQMRWAVGQTSVDLACNHIVVEALQSLPGEYSIFSEEKVLERPKTDKAFLVDPLDGTHNAYAGYPAFTCSVAFYEGGSYRFGWVYDISRDLIYSAAAGQGAHLQTPLALRKLAVGKAKAIDESAVAFLRATEEKAKRTIERILWKSKKIRLSSCSSLDICLAASGVLDIFLDISTPGHERSCDIAASSVILQEAGGQLFDLNGRIREILPPSRLALNDFGGVIACSSYQSVSDILSQLND